MPNLVDSARRATDRPPVAVLHEPRCLVVRDAGARCTACADACPADALVVRTPVEESAQPYGSFTPTGAAGPLIDGDACVRCGACVTSCPTNALLPLPPLDDETLLGLAAAAATAAVAHAEDAADDAREGGEGAPEPATAGFACERVAQALRLDGGRVVVLPCLAWVDAALLVHAACGGAARIAVPLDACPSCELTPAAQRVEAAVADARRICAVAQLGTAIETSDGAALHSLEAAPDADAAGELSRRNLFAQAGASLVDTARAEAARQLGSLAGAPAHADASPEPDARRWSMLDDLHAAGLADGGGAVPRTLAPRVDIDVEHCSGCAQCALFCPTGALRKAGRLAGGHTLLEFDPSRCRDCSVCESTCRYGALNITEDLAAAELFALAPREIVIPKRRVLPERRRNA